MNAPPPTPSFPFLSRRRFLKNSAATVATLAAARLLRLAAQTTPAAPANPAAPVDIPKKTNPP